MNLCITRPNQSGYSETFLDNQIRFLNPKISVWNGWYPSILSSGRSFLPFPFSLHLVRGTVRNLFPKAYHRIYSHFFSSLLLKNNIDVVLANYGPGGATLINACEKANVKLFVHFHGFDASAHETLKQYKQAYQLLFKKAAGIIVVSNDMKTQLLSLGADEEKLHLNPYGVNLNDFTPTNPQANDPIFISIGRFTAKKAPLLTIKAFNHMLASCPNALLKMVGDGQLLEDAKKLTEELGIVEKVQFMGVKNPTEVAQLLKEARAFIQHSVTAPSGDAEGTPNTILEASATGLPIVSTLHAGIKDAVINGETGFLVKEGNWQQMAQHMITLASDPQLAASMGRAGRIHMEKNYEIGKQLNKLKEILSH